MRESRTRTSTTMTTRPDEASSAPSTGIAVVDKPAGLTSHQVVARLRRLVGTRKVGHAGTLDPMATGVLVMGIGRATRLLGYLALTDKAYEATIRLGIGTITDDAAGEVSSRPGAAHLADDQIQAAVAALHGEIWQVPTAVSAIKTNGVRSYARVRAGEDVELAARPVEIARFEVLARRDLSVDQVFCVDLDVAVECSTGTYVRALARDLGAALGSAGHLTALRRTRVGPFGIDQAQTLAQAATDLRLISMNAVVRLCFATITLSPTQATDVRHGRRLSGLDLPATRAALLDETGEFLALYRRLDDDAIPEAVFV
jgi:tRNA pseudouridine55 synthase